MSSFDKITPPDSPEDKNVAALADDQAVLPIAADAELESGQAPLGPVTGQSSPAPTRLRYSCLSLKV